MENVLKEFLTDEMKISYDSEKQTENADNHTRKDNEFLKHVPLFSDLDDNTIDLISKSGSRKSFNKDAVVLLEHEPGSALFIIISGKVKVSRVSDDGKEVILRILNQYDFFGEMSVLDGFSRSANIIAMQDSQLFIIRGNEFINMLYNNSKISSALLFELIQRLRAADMKIKSLSIKDAEGRVASVILQLADDVGRIKQGAVEIEKLPLQYDLANMAGTSRETISRTLHSFSKKGLVELQGSMLKILNYEKFKELFN